MVEADIKTNKLVCIWEKNDYGLFTLNISSYHNQSAFKMYLEI